MQWRYRGATVSPLVSDVYIVQHNFIYNISCRHAYLLGQKCVGKRKGRITKKLLINSTLLFSYHPQNCTLSSRNNGKMIRYLPSTELLTEFALNDKNIQSHTWHTRGPILMADPMTDRLPVNGTADNIAEGSHA